MEASRQGSRGSDPHEVENLHRNLQSTLYICGSPSTDSTNLRSKIFRENKILESSKRKKLEFAICYKHLEQLTQLTLQQHYG